MGCNSSRQVKELTFDDICNQNGYKLKQTTTDSTKSTDTSLPIFVSNKIELKVYIGIRFIGRLFHDQTYTLDTDTIEYTWVNKSVFYFWKEQGDIYVRIENTNKQVLTEKRKLVLGKAIDVHHPTTELVNYCIILDLVDKSSQVPLESIKHIKKQ